MSELLVRLAPNGGGGAPRGCKAIYRICMRRKWTILAILVAHSHIRASIRPADSQIRARLLTPRLQDSGLQPA